MDVPLQAVISMEEQTEGRANKQLLRATDLADLTKTGLNLVYTGVWLKSRQSDFFKKFGLTLPQHNLLRILSDQQAVPIGVNQVQKRMLDKSSNVSRIASKLLKKNLIVCQHSGKDRRAMELFIAQAGLDLLRTIDSEAGKINSLLGHLTPKEIVQLNKLLIKVRAARE